MHCEPDPDHRDARAVSRARASPVATLNAALKPWLIGAIIAASLVYCVRLPTPYFDFRAFYCAGHAELTGADPYREHPLHECEQAIEDIFEPPPAKIRLFVTVPAPFPGFVLAGFALLAMLPFGAALAVWSVLIAAALGIAVVCVARTTDTPLWASLAVLGYPASIVALPLGQPTPLVLAAVAGAALLLTRGRPRAAAAAALVALADPHVGIALVLSLFVSVRRTRAVLAAGVAGLAALGLVASGPAREWEYVTAVLPAHALANISDGMQFSVTNFAYTAGVPAAAALRLGAFWYAAALAAGIVIARRLRVSLGERAIAYIPPALAVFGGPHTHLQQLAVALPAFLLVTSIATGRRRILAAVVTFAAAIPWICVAPYPLLALGPPLLALVFAADIGCRNAAVPLAAACMGVLQVLHWSIERWLIARPFPSIAITGNPLAEVSWQMFITAKNVPIEAWCIIARLPTVGAFVVFFALLVIAMRDPRSFTGSIALKIAR